MSVLVPDETILGLIAAGEARHGYDLIEVFRDSERLGLVWKLSTSQVYAVLKRLEQTGLIIGQQVDIPDAPARREYRLTPQGESRLRAWLDEREPSPSIRRVRVEMMSRLYITRLLDESPAPLLTRQRMTCERQLALLTRKREQKSSWMADLALELSIAQLQAVLDWIRVIEKQWMISTEA